MEAVQGIFASLGLDSDVFRDMMVPISRRFSIRRGCLPSEVPSRQSGDSRDLHGMDLWIHPSWCRSLNRVTMADLDEEEADEGGGQELNHYGRKRRVTFIPGLDMTHTIFYRGHFLKVTRARRYQDYGQYWALKISVVARNNDILKRLVKEAKDEYEKDAEHRLHIFLADPKYACWRWNGTRQKRPMSSIILEPPVKEMLLTDCRDFLGSEDWYLWQCIRKGIPFRRGYLLYGMPGSGKDSLIHSLAGELGLDIYVVNLSSKGMSDETLMTLMGSVPSRCIVLLEDLDAASEANDDSTLSLSGLSGCLDWIANEEGRRVLVTSAAFTLFITTNHLERIDPALNRPGRMDVRVNLPNATKWQAENIFKHFFPSRPSSTSTAPHDAPSVDASRRNPLGLGPGPRTRSSAHTVPILDDVEIAWLARRFADAIPEGEMSVRAIFTQSRGVMFLQIGLFVAGRQSARIFDQEQDAPAAMRRRSRRMGTTRTGGSGLDQARVRCKRERVNGQRMTYKSLRRPKCVCYDCDEQVAAGTARTVEPCAGGIA
ncbi:P-loop containing nucleoside triphosphate hydrolase protein [Russula earlei]|uniref:P-loop containing nucleoside triphosphate hydrolase protein n=1 Tax=Russula earlei TaxID=71964 RepID=A0ACC0U8C5_9AGAM|nr:P-loop containing nucleoside triphosphate hydrolase protein [Russula earlei]